MLLFAAHTLDDSNNLPYLNLMLFVLLFSAAHCVDLFGVLLFFLDDVMLCRLVKGNYVIDLDRESVRLLKNDINSKEDRCIGAGKCYGIE